MFGICGAPICVLVRHLQGVLATAILLNLLRYGDWLVGKDWSWVCIFRLLEKGVIGVMWGEINKTLSVCCLRAFLDTTAPRSYSVSRSLAFVSCENFAYPTRFLVQAARASHSNGN